MDIQESRKLTDNELDGVNGGIAPLVVAVGFGAARMIGAHYLRRAAVTRTGAAVGKVMNTPAGPVIAQQGMGQVAG